MSFFEKLAYFSLSATGFAVIVLVHYLLSKSTTTTTTSANVNKSRNTVLLDDDQKRSASTNAHADDCCNDDDDADRDVAVDDDANNGKPNATVGSTQQFLKKRTVIRPSMSYRPRGILARAVYEKVHNDQYLDGYDMQLVSVYSTRQTPVCPQSIFNTRLTCPHPYIYHQHTHTHTSVVQTATAAERRAIPAEIRAYCGARSADAQLAGRRQAAVVEFLAAIVASGRTHGADHIHDANGRQWVWYYI